MNKIKINISESLSKKDIIARVPLLAKSIAEGILEKSRRMSRDLDGKLFSDHPIKGIAKSESAMYDAGGEVLEGIQNWLIRSLSLEARLTKSQGVDSRDDVRSQFGITLGDNVTEEQAKEIAEALTDVPVDFYDGRLSSISVDSRMDTKSDYPNHGRYIESKKRMVLNPRIFGETATYDGSKISKVAQVVLHEIGHAVDDNYGFSGTKRWRDISGWKFIGSDDPPDGYDRLVLQDKGRMMLKGKWGYREGTEFARWYGARNPKEDFCEAFVFAMKGIKSVFKGPSGKKKLEFLNDILGGLRKSERVFVDSEWTDDSLEKSQEFQAYLEFRMPALLEKAMDESDAMECVRSEFCNEPCGELYLTGALLL